MFFIIPLYAISFAFNANHSSRSPEQKILGWPKKRPYLPPKNPASRLALSCDSIPDDVDGWLAASVRTLVLMVSRTRSLALVRGSKRWTRGRSGEWPIVFCASSIRSISSSAPISAWNRHNNTWNLPSYCSTSCDRLMCSIPSVPAYYPTHKQAILTHSKHWNCSLVLQKNWCFAYSSTCMLLFVSKPLSQDMLNVV